MVCVTWFSFSKAWSLTSSYWRWQGRSPRRIIPSAGQIEEGPPSLSHPDPYISFREALWRNSWLCWDHKHGSSLLQPTSISFPCKFSKVFYEQRGQYGIYLSCQQALVVKFLKMDKPVFCQVRTDPKSHWLHWGLLRSSADLLSQRPLGQSLQLQWNWAFLQKCCLDCSFPPLTLQKKGARSIWEPRFIFFCLKKKEKKSRLQSIPAVNMWYFFKGNEMFMKIWHLGFLDSLLTFFWFCNTGTAA